MGNGGLLSQEQGPRQENCRTRVQDPGFGEFRGKAKSREIELWF